MEHICNTPTVVFIDIGGNRDLKSVLQMLEWVKSVLSPRLIIVKSEELVDSIEGYHKKSQRLSLSLPSLPENQIETYFTEIQPCGRIKNGDEWFNYQLSTRSEQLNESATHSTSSMRKFPHPKKAPLSFSPGDGKTPICRYHNYHRKGCRQLNCPYDHVYCHWCLQKGHQALTCRNRYSEGGVKSLIRKCREDFKKWS